MDEFDVECPECGAQLTVGEDVFGQALPCPACGRELRFLADEEETPGELPPTGTGSRPRIRPKRRRLRNYRRAEGGVYGPVAAKARTSTNAVISLVCGFLGFLLLPALVGLLFAWMALGEIRRSGGLFKGRGLALCGLCLNGFWLLLVVAGMVFGYRDVKADRNHTARCRNNLDLIWDACQAHAQKSGGLLPRDLKLLAERGLLSEENPPRCDRGIAQASTGGHFDPFTGYQYFGHGVSLQHPQLKNLVIAACEEGNGVILLFGDGRVITVPSSSLYETCDRNRWLIPGETDQLPDHQRRLLSYGCLVTRPSSWRWFEPETPRHILACAANATGDQFLLLTAVKETRPDPFDLNACRRGFGSLLDDGEVKPQLMEDQMTTFEDCPAYLSQWEHQGIRISLCVFYRDNIGYAVAVSRPREAMSDEKALTALGHWFSFRQ